MNETITFDLANEQGNLNAILIDNSDFAFVDFGIGTQPMTEARRRVVHHRL